MKLRTSILIQLGFLAVMLLISVYYFQRLPDRVPTHWNIHNQVDQYGGKLVPVLMGPLMMLFGLLLTIVLPKISPKKFEIDTFMGTYSFAMVLVSALFLFLNILILRATDGTKLDFGSTFMAGMFVFFALIGNLFGKVRRNFFMGIRTPWTLASEPVWDATHRSAGRVWFVGGLFGAVLALLGMPILGSVAIILVLSVWPVIQSYFIYKKLEA
jgi:uncharacterized membrane protein